jgi:hypothetical protein
VQRKKEKLDKAGENNFLKRYERLLLFIGMIFLQINPYSRTHLDWSGSIGLRPESVLFLKVPGSFFFGVNLGRLI